MKARTLGAVFFLIALPVAVAAIEAVHFHVHNRNNGTLVSSGQRREYLLYVPKSYDRTKPAPLVISMHGAASWPAAQRDVSQWNRLADEHGFIVVYPSGADIAGPTVWRVNRTPGLMRDVRFISDLIDTLQASYNIDPSRIYANGLSNGGGMSFVLSCTLSERIAAIGMVASAQTLPWNWCEDDRPIPVIAFHGTADRQVPYKGGGSHEFPNVATFVANWAGRNRCGAKPVETAIAGDVTRFAYAGCADHADVILYTIEGGGHTWPGGRAMPEWLLGPVHPDLDATREIWAFFRDRRLPRR